MAWPPVNLTRLFNTLIALNIELLVDLVVKFHLRADLDGIGVRFENELIRRLAMSDDGPSDRVLAEMFGCSTSSIARKKRAESAPMASLCSDRRYYVNCVFLRLRENNSDGSNSDANAEVEIPLENVLCRVWVLEDMHHLAELLRSLREEGLSNAQLVEQALQQVRAAGARRELEIIPLETLCEWLLQQDELPVGRLDEWEVYIFLERIDSWREGGVLCDGEERASLGWRSARALLIGLINDYTEIGVLEKVSRRQEALTYRVQDSTGLEQAFGDLGTEEEEIFQKRLWVTIYRLCQLSVRDGGSPWIRYEQLAELLHIEPITLPRGEIATHLEKLREDGQVQVEPDAPITEESLDQVRLASFLFRTQPNEPTGADAAVYDHINAFTTALSHRLMRLRDEALGPDPRAPRWFSEAKEVGTSTYSFDIWADHPLRGEVTGLLDALRTTSTELRERVQAHNAKVGVPRRGLRRLMVYFGAYEQVASGPTEEPSPTPE